MNDDAMLQYLIEMGAIQAEDTALQRRQAMAEMLRQRQPADTGLQQAGRVTVAANPLAHMANAFNQAQAGYMQGQAMGGMDALAKKRADVLQRLRGGQQQGPGELSGGVGAQPY